MARKSAYVVYDRESRTSPVIALCKDFPTAEQTTLNYAKECYGEVMKSMPYTLTLDNCPVFGINIHRATIVGSLTDNTPVYIAVCDKINPILCVGTNKQEIIDYLRNWFATNTILAPDSVEIELKLIQNNDSDLVSLYETQLVA